jgi:hypothetical protein
MQPYSNRSLAAALVLMPTTLSVHAEIKYLNPSQYKQESVELPPLQINTDISTIVVCLGNKEHGHHKIQNENNIISVLASAECHNLSYQNMTTFVAQNKTVAFQITYKYIYTFIELREQLVPKQQCPSFLCEHPLQTKLSAKPLDRVKIRR